MRIEFDVVLILDIVRTVCIIGTFLISVSLFRLFLRNKLSERQLDLVIELIDKISSTKFNISYRYIGVAQCSKTLFNIVSDSSRSDKYLCLTEDMFEYLILLLSDYCDNPLLPRSIAKKLRKLKPRSHRSINSKIYPASLEECQFSDCEIYLTSKPINESNFKIFKSNFIYYGDFQNACKDLTISIEKWLKTYGIKDVNSLS